MMAQDGDDQPVSQTKSRVVPKQVVAAGFSNSMNVDTTSKPSPTRPSLSPSPPSPFDAAAAPSVGVLRGAYVTLEPLTLTHVEDLWISLGPNAGSHAMWEFRSGVTIQSAQELWEMFQDRVFLAVRLHPPRQLQHAADMPGDLTAADAPPIAAAFASRAFDVGPTRGIVGLHHILPEHRSLEVAVLLGPELQRSRAASEAIYLLLRNVFDATPESTCPGYNRVAWTCDGRHVASKRAAERLGFVWEGRLRDHEITVARDGGRRMRDTDVFSLLEGEWNGEGKVRQAMESWLEDSNFDQEGRQRRRLEEIRKELKGKPDG